MYGKLTQLNELTWRLYEAMSQYYEQLTRTAYARTMLRPPSGTFPN